MVSLPKETKAHLATHTTQLSPGDSSAINSLTPGGVAEI